MLEYSKEKWFPFYEKLLDFSEMNKIIFSSLSREDYYNNLLTNYIEKKLEISSNTKMWKLIKEMYKYNKPQFLAFVKLNLTKDFSYEFQTTWEIIKNLLQDIENELFKSIEQSQYKAFSGWLYKKYDNLIKSLFPYINNVGVIVR